MLKRIIFGSLLIVFAGGLFYADARLEQAGVPSLAVRGPAGAVVGLPLGLTVMALAAVGFLEYARMARSAGQPVLGATGATTAAAMAGWPLWRQPFGGEQASGAAALALAAGATAAVFAAQLVRHRTERAIARAAATLLGVAYVGVCGALVLELRMGYGVAGVLLTVLAAKFTDIGAYFVGSRVGRHKMAPALSPAKSWEGLAGGLAVGTGMTVAVATVLRPLLLTPLAGAAGPLTIAWPAAAVFGLALGLAGQAADLCESALKRDAGIKDSAALIPSFGGVLDILDSVLLSAPVAWLLLRWWG
jgi:phosphatidate cytidylyltransferase